MSALPRTTQNLQAIVVIKMDMEGGNNDFVVIVLDVGQGGLDVLLVVVINQRDGAGDLCGAEFLPVLDELVADHVGDGLRPIVVALLFSHSIQLFEQLRRQRDAKPRYLILFHNHLAWRES